MNGSHTKPEQVFTLAHELARILLGASGDSGVEPILSPSQATESWCSPIAAELLVLPASLAYESREHHDLGYAIE